MHLKTNLNILLPHKPGIGGPGSFQTRFENFLKKNGHSIYYMNASQQQKIDLIMVVGGTKRIFELVKYKIRGVPIIYRLDGINWLHKKKKISFKNYLTTEYRNYLSKVIHGFIANHIIYQSHFVQRWWDKDGFKRKHSFDIIYNGVDTIEFCPSIKQDSEDKYRLICLEGTLDYSPYAIDMLNYIAENLPKAFTIDLYGGFEKKGTEKDLASRLNYHGHVSREEVPNVMKGGIYLSMDVNAACPNAVIEALSSGTPVVGFDTGALSELVDSRVGEIVPFGGNPWNLDKPDYKGLTNAIIKVSENYFLLAKNARRKALSEFSIERIMSDYLNIINIQLT